MSTNFYLWIAMAQMGKHLPTTWDPGLIPGMGRSSGEGNGKPLQYSGLENSMDGGAWWAIVHGVAKSRIQLSDFTSPFCLPRQTKDDLGGSVHGGPGIAPLGG